ncbi:MAG: hypothetical protein ACTHN0_05855 [Aquihabitans sp.]
MGDGDDGGTGPSGRSAALDLEHGWVPLALLTLAVCLPILLAVVDAARADWVPTADAATIVTRAFDMWSPRRPLVGQFSLAGSEGAKQVFSPGPLLYVVLAPAARFGPAWSLPLTMGLVASTCFGIALHAARRIGGWWFAVVVAAGLVGTIRASDAATFVEVWNPWAGLAPFAALVMVCWLIALGNRWWLVPAIVLASFLVQAHLTYLPPSLVLLAVAVVGGWWPGVGDEAGDRDGSSRARSAPVSRVRPVGWAVVAFLVCWALPLYQQFTTTPGNLTLVREAAGAENETFGSGVAVNVWWRASGLLPAFARSAGTQVAELDEIRVAASPAAWIGTVLLALALVALGWIAWRRAARDVVIGVALALGLAVAALAVAARLPLDRLIVAPYSLRWVVTAGLVPWLVAALAVGRFGLLRRWTPSATIRRAAPVTAVAVVALGALTVSRTDHAAWMIDPARIAGEDLVAATAPGDRIRLADSGRYEIVMTPALAWSLRQHDRTPVMIRNFRVGTGEIYAKDGSRCDGIVSLRGASEAPPAGGREISRVSYEQPGDPQEVVVYLAPDDSADGLC